MTPQTIASKVKAREQTSRAVEAYRKLLASVPPQPRVLVRHVLTHRALERLTP